MIEQTCISPLSPGGGGFGGSLGAPLQDSEEQQSSTSTAYTASLCICERDRPTDPRSTRKLKRKDFFRAFWLAFFWKLMTAPQPKSSLSPCSTFTSRPGCRNGTQYLSLVMKACERDDAVTYWKDEEPLDTRPYIQHSLHKTLHILTSHKKRNLEDNRIHLLWVASS